jgi:hypothetical protein
MATGRSGDRILVGARFSAPVKTSPEAHPAPYKMGPGSLSGAGGFKLRQGQRKSRAALLLVL